MSVNVELSVVIPAYNEEHAIGDVLDELRRVLLDNGVSHEIIVVDDGSNDGTIEEVKRRSDIIIVQHPHTMGYGAALKSGIRRSKGKFTLTIDADGTYPTRDVPKLLRHRGEYDMIVGARIGKNVRIPLLRRLARFILCKLANYLAGTNIPDLNSGMRVFEKRVADRFLKILPSGFSFTATMTLAYLANNYLIKYVPVDYYARTGKSKVSPIKDTVSFVMLILRTAAYFDPMKVFAPVATLFFLCAVTVFVYSTFKGRFMDVTTTVLLVGSIQLALFGILADLVVKRLGNQ